LGNKTYGFSRRKRLQNPDFQSVFKEPIKNHSSYFTVLARENGKNIPRLGAVVSKRNVRNAVQRNLIRRLMRESFRLNQEKLKGFDVVVILRREVWQRTHDKTPNECLEKHWRQLAMLNKKL